MDLVLQLIHSLLQTIECVLSVVKAQINVCSCALDGTLEVTLPLALSEQVHGCKHNPQHEQVQKHASG